MNACRQYSITGAAIDRSLKIEYRANATHFRVVLLTRQLSMTLTNRKMHELALKLLRNALTIEGKTSARNGAVSDLLWHSGFKDEAGTRFDFRKLRGVQSSNSRDSAQRIALVKSIVRQYATIARIVRCTPIELGEFISRIGYAVGKNIGSPPHAEARHDVHATSRTALSR